MFEFPKFDPDWWKGCVDCKHFKMSQDSPIKLCLVAPKRTPLGYTYAIDALQLDGPCGPERKLRVDAAMKERP